MRNDSSGIHVINNSKSINCDVAEDDKVGSGRAWGLGSMGWSLNKGL